MAPLSRASLAGNHFGQSQTKTRDLFTLADTSTSRPPPSPPEVPSFPSSKTKGLRVPTINPSFFSFTLLSSAHSFSCCLATLFENESTRPRTRGESAFRRAPATGPLTMDSDIMDASDFGNDYEDESDAYSPEAVSLATIQRNQAAVPS